MHVCLFFPFVLGAFVIFLMNEYWNIGKNNVASKNKMIYDQSFPKEL